MLASAIWMTASILWAVACFPSAYKLFKDKDSAGQSVIGWLLNDFANTCACACGILWAQPVLFWSELFFTGYCLLMTVLVILYRKKKK